MTTPGNSLNIKETGFQSFDGVSVFKGRTLTAGTGISISNGTGVSGNPTISLSGSEGGSYALSLTQLDIQSSVADSTTYYVTYGTPTGIWFPNTPSNGGRIWIPKSGTIRAAYGAFGVVNQLASAQNTIVRIRVNNTTNYDITTTALLTASLNPFSNSALAIPVTAGDYFHFQVVTPVYTTNPVGVLFQCSIYIS